MLGSILGLPQNQPSRAHRASQTLKQHTQTLHGPEPGPLLIHYGRVSWCSCGTSTNSWKGVSDFKKQKELICRMGRRGKEELRGGGGGKLWLEPNVWEEHKSSKTERQRVGTKGRQMAKWRTQIHSQQTLGWTLVTARVTEMVAPHAGVCPTLKTEAPSPRLTGSTVPSTWSLLCCTAHTWGIPTAERSCQHRPKFWLKRRRHKIGKIVAAPRSL